MTQKSFIARIIPAPPTDKDGISVTTGTRVMVGDVELTGVTKITLVADVNDVWKAQIECYFQPTDMTAAAFVYKPSVLQRLKWWLFGYRYAKGQPKC